MSDKSDDALVSVRHVPCPTCCSQPGADCISVDGHPLLEQHHARWRRAVVRPYGEGSSSPRLIFSDAAAEEVRRLLQVRCDCLLGLQRCRDVDSMDALQATLTETESALGRLLADAAGASWLMYDRGRLETARGVRCPFCEAEQGRPCASVEGDPLMEEHHARWKELAVLMRDRYDEMSASLSEMLGHLHVRRLP